MALLEHLNQLTGVGVILAGDVQSHVVLDVHPANVGNQRLVGGRVERFAVPDQLLELRIGCVRGKRLVQLSQFGIETACAQLRQRQPPVILGELLGTEIGDPAPVFARLAVVATHAILIEHRLHFAFEVEAPRLAVPGLDFDGRTRAGQLEARDGRIPRLLVAADTGRRLTRHRRVPAPHQLKRFALRVQRLNADRRAGGHAERG